jgi:hypothetical protein
MDQKKINENLEKVFDLEPMVSNQIDQIPKKKGRGGPRPNSGRKVGSKVRLSSADILAEIAKRDVPFEQGLAEDYARARAMGDLQVIQRYQQMFLNKIVADKHEIDHTTLGESMKANFTFQQKELPDWNSIPKTITVK